MISAPASKLPNKDTLNSIVSLHRRGTSGLRTGLLLSHRLDQIIRQIYQRLEYPAKSHVALIALGGYGRKELCFGSDTDIMFLIPADHTEPGASFAVQKLLYGLLDAGMDIGHSVRTTEECLALHGNDIESWVSLLESRLICGNEKLFAQFRKAIATEIGPAHAASFVRDILDRLDERHKKYGDSSKLLEPNVKNSSGGLRDLHTALWLVVGTGLFRLPATAKPNATALTTVFRSAWIREQLGRQSIHDASTAFDFILRTRNEMHLQGKGLHDGLEFTLQQRVAEALGYKSKKNRSSVEQFMQDYYLAARGVTRFTRRVVSIVEHEFLESSSHPPAEDLDQWFSIKGDLLLPARRRTLTNEILLRGVLHTLRRRVRFSHELEEMIDRQLRRFMPLRSATETALFRELLNQPLGVAEALARLNDYGVLSRWIPEWNGMVAFFQHNQYHYYTADEHTLRVVSNAESLTGNEQTLGRVFRNLPRKDTLYLACLFHDIAKPRRVGGHEVAGARTAEQILKRLRYTDIAPDVRFLIRHHLLMEQVAFRRNLSDPQTVIDFAATFATATQLDYLYVLTYSDLSAVNRNVWTDWKGMLLHELYKKTKDVLERSLTSEEVHATARSEHQTAVSQLVETLADAIPHESSRGHLEAIDSPAYLATFDPSEIAEHIRHIEQSDKVAATFRHQSKHTEVTLIARDAPFLLSQFCGVLSANDANIFDAQIFTRSDGIIIDRFRVTDFVSRGSLTELQCTKIRREIDAVVRGELDIDDLLTRHRMKWRRRARSHNPGIRFDVVFEDHPRFTIIDLFAADMLGFLYKVTETMSRLRLNIYFAKIATRADGIVDSFYVLDASGKRIDAPEQKNTIRHELLATMNQLSTKELVLT